ncbi:MAG: TolC family protein [Capnocytophaga sp.]|nr:TolC family protein [Capnocytophaga sp.]
MRAFRYLAILLIPMVGNAQTIWTLEQCIDHVLDNNISIKQSEIDLQATSVDKLTAVGAFLPSVSSNMSYNYNQGKNINPVTNQFETTKFQSASGGVNAGINLFSGLANWRQLRLAELSKLSGQYNLNKIKDDIVLMVVNSYLEVISNKEQIKALENQLEVTEQNLQRTRDLIDAGALPQGDIYDIEAQLLSQEQQIILTQNNLFISKMGLAQLLLLKDYYDFDVADAALEIPITDILSYNPDAIFQKSKEVIQDLKIAQTNVQIAETNLKLARASYSPRLSAFAGYSTQWSKNYPNDFWSQFNDNIGFSAGLSLSIPIFNGFSVRGNVTRARLNLDKSQWANQQAELTAERTVFQAYNDAANAEKLYTASEKTAQAKKQAAQYAQDRFEVGLMNSFDFNQAKMQQQNAETESIRAKYQYIFKIKVLEYYFGIQLWDKNEQK